MEADGLWKFKKEMSLKILGNENIFLALRSPITNRMDGSLNLP
jgi:hypothetical protein